MRGALPRNEPHAPNDLGLVFCSFEQCVLATRSTLVLYMLTRKARKSRVLVQVTLDKFIFNRSKNSGDEGYSMSLKHQNYMSHCNQRHPIDVNMK